MDLHEELWGLVEVLEEQSGDLAEENEPAAAEVSAQAARNLAKALTRHNIPRPRTCGECGWWDDGGCVAERPIWVRQEKYGVLADKDATNCPCFKPRD